MHGTQVYSAAEIKKQCEEIWNGPLVLKQHICLWSFWHFKSYGWKYNFMSCVAGRIAKFKDYRAAQLRRIRKHQVYET